MEAEQEVKQELKEIKESLKIIRDCLQILVRRLVYQWTETSGSITIQARLEGEQNGHNAPDQER